jgi:hypothetical protein
MQAGCHLHATTAVLPPGKQLMVLTQRKSSRTADKTRAFSTQDSDGREWVPYDLSEGTRDVTSSATFGYLHCGTPLYARRGHNVVRNNNSVVTSTLKQGCTNTRHWLAMATRFCKVAPKSVGSQYGTSFTSTFCGEGFRGDV